MVRRFVSALVLCCVVVGLVGGCNSGPKLVPVKGRLTLKGKPCPGVAVNLNTGEVNGQGFIGSTDGDGNFVMHNLFGKPGVTPGNYTVAITIPIDSPGGSMVPAALCGKTSPWKVTIADAPERVLDLDMSKPTAE